MLLLCYVKWSFNSLMLQNVFYSATNTKMQSYIESDRCFAIYVNVVDRGVFIYNIVFC